MPIKRASFFCLTLGSAGALIGMSALLSRTAQAQLGGSLPAFIKLQATTPGSVQSGNMNISGTTISGQFKGGGAGITNVDAALLNGNASSAFLKSNQPFEIVNLSSNCVISGINTSNVNGTAGVCGQSTATSGATYGVYGLNTSTNGFGVYGLSLASSGASACGVYGGTYSDLGSGVYGVSASNTGPGAGMSGLSYGNSGSGVWGWASSPTGVTQGVYGKSDSSSGRGVYGLASSTSGSAYGGWFRSESVSGRGVYGIAATATGTNYGVYGESSSTAGTGVFGRATTTTGANFGAYFQTDSVSGVGVFGYSTATGLGVTGTGVYGVSNGKSGIAVRGRVHALDVTWLGYGVLGENPSPAGYAVYANGMFGAVAGKSFRIDHPDDPEGKYLLHYSAEGPEVINFYRGNVVLDRTGSAVVELPRYFGKINKDPSYQLTAVGAAMPNLHVSVPISEAALAKGEKAGPNVLAPLCSFGISGGAPGCKVSWEVKAVRNDLWMRQYGSPVEVEKQGLERGMYQRPELYGKPANQGMFFDRTSETPAQNSSSHP